MPVDDPQTELAPFIVESGSGVIETKTLPLIRVVQTVVVFDARTE